jgi:hypothetical protein
MFIYFHKYMYKMYYVKVLGDPFDDNFGHLFDDLWLDKIIPKNNDEGRAIYGNLMQDPKSQHINYV